MDHHEALASLIAATTRLRWSGLLYLCAALLGRVSRTSVSRFLQDDGAISGKLGNGSVFSWEKGKWAVISPAGHFVEWDGRRLICDVYPDDEKAEGWGDRAATQSITAGKIAEHRELSIFRCWPPQVVIDVIAEAVAAHQTWTNQRVDVER